MTNNIRAWEDQNTPGNYGFTRVEETSHILTEQGRPNKAVEGSTNQNVMQDLISEMPQTEVRDLRLV
jgi:hypothetical protein